MEGTSAIIPTLETERLLLRQLTLDDAPDYFEFSSDPEVARFITQPTHTTLDEARQRISELLVSLAAGEHRQWGIVLKETGKLIGACGMFGDSERDRRAEMGYNLNRAHWNRGYMSEAVRALISFGFADLGINRLEALCFTDNLASERVMQKVGMSYEGILRQYLFIKGEFKDVKVYSILRHEWDNGQS